ncbi:MAG: patatin-like phospholipase family protein [Bacillota bacterium]
MKYRFMSDQPADLETALVLSGGGAKGAYQAGVIRKFLKMGIRFELVVGSSIGAVNGVLLAEFIQTGMDIREICCRFEEIWLSLDGFLSLDWLGFLRNVFTPINIPSIYDINVVRRILSLYIPRNRYFSDYTKCQLSVTGTNLSKRKLTIFDFNSTVPVIDAVIASMSYPVAFPAVEIAGDFYIDGGALSNAPLKEAVEWGVENIYLVFLRPLDVIENGKKGNENREENGYSALEVVGEFFEMASNKLMYGDLKKAEYINQLINLLNEYQHRLPVNFVKKLHKLNGIKFGEGKKIINITKVAPHETLEPPGLSGFRNKKAIRKIMKMGEDDASKVFSLSQ